MNVLLGVTGGIAAYKVCDLIVGLKKNDYDVKVVMTENAKKFITPVTLSTLSKNSVIDSMWNNEGFVNHIELAKWCDVFVIYPATANTIAKFVNGVADDLLSSIYLALPEGEQDRFIFPAMNTVMYGKFISTKNRQHLRNEGCIVAGTRKTMLACGDYGDGGLMKPRDAVNKIIKENTKTERCEVELEIEKIKILVTSGGTREYIDDVRVLTNISSGKLGAMIADKYAENPICEVHFVSSKACMHPSNNNIFVHNINDVKDLVKVTDELVPKSNIVIHAMAVSDFGFSGGNNVKLSSQDEKGFVEFIASTIKKNPKVISKFRDLNPNAFLVGFKFEVGKSHDDLIDIAKKSMNENRLNMVLANDKVEMKQEKRHVGYLLNEYGEVTKCLGKKEIAETIVNETLVEYWK